MRKVLMCLSIVLIALAIGCEGGGKAVTPADRNAATPDKEVGLGGLPPTK